MRTKGLSKIKIDVAGILFIFAIGLVCGHYLLPADPPVRLLDPIQLQEYLNMKIEQDPQFELLEVDGRIGAKTIEAWEYYSAMEMKL